MIQAADQSTPSIQARRDAAAAMKTVDDIPTFSLFLSAIYIYRERDLCDYAACGDGERLNRSHQAAAAAPYLFRNADVWRSRWSGAQAQCCYSDREGSIEVNNL